MKRRYGLVIAALAVIVAPVATVRADDANRECDNDQDITVVIDFQELGGGVNVRCASPPPFRSGFEVLQRADITYDQYQGFVCRIAGKPSSDPCDHYPSSGPYWAYWYAARGGQWKYSPQGAGARKPPPGSVDGWSYADASGHASPPRYAVPSAIVDNTTSTTVESPTPSPMGASPKPKTRGPSATTTSTGASTTTAVDLAQPSVSSTTTRETVAALGHVDLSSGGGDGGTSTGFIASVGVLAALVAGAIGLARHRTRSS